MNFQLSVDLKEEVVKKELRFPRLVDSFSLPALMSFLLSAILSYLQDRVDFSRSL